MGFPYFPAIAALLLLCPAGAAADDARNVYAPPAAFWLIPSNHSPQLYGPSEPTANWAFAQWNIPDDLPPFTSRDAGDEKISENPYATVIVGHDSYTLRQTLPPERSCERVYPSGRRLVDEFDLFAQPNNRNFPSFPQAAQEVGATLDKLSHVNHHITVTVKSAKLSDAGCRVTQSALLTAVVLTNKEAKQTFFYQIRLGVFRAIGDDLHEELPRPGWFFTGKNTQSGAAHQFGYGDNIETYQAQPAQLEQKTSYSIDLLPRLKALISEGSIYGLDQDLSKWAVSGTYHGQNLFGHMSVESTWSDFSLQVE